MSDTYLKRDKLRNLYGESWKYKVDRMSDEQVIAIYLKFLKEGKIK